MKWTIIYDEFKFKLRTETQALFKTSVVNQRVVNQM